MKKTLSLFLAALMLFSIFAVSTFAATAPEVTQVTSTFKGVEITWTASADSSTYIIYRNGVVIGTTVDCKYVDETVEAGSTYTYTVAAQAKDESFAPGTDEFEVTYIVPYCEHSDYEYVVDYPATVFNAGLKHKKCNTCGVDLEGEAIKQLVPESPVINYLSNGVKGVKVAWNEVDGATLYRVYRRAGGETTYTLLKDTKGTSFEDTTAKSGIYYKYVIRAKNAAGWSKYIGGNVIRRVGTPMNLTAANTLGGIYVKWNAVENATSYRVYRKLVGDENWSYIKTVKGTYYFDTAVEAGSDYIYTVRAVAGKVYSNFLPGAQIRRLEIAKLNGTKSTAEGVYIDFEPVEGASGYNVYRKVGNGSWTAGSYLGTIRTTKSHTYLDVSAKKGVTYTYTVKAYYKNGSHTSVASYEAKGISCKDVY